MIYSAIFACIAALTLSACAAHIDGGRVRVPGADISIDGHSHGHSHGNGFCPPGQAKKGNC